MGSRLRRLVVLGALIAGSVAAWPAAEGAAATVLPDVMVYVPRDGTMATVVVDEARYKITIPPTRYAFSGRFHGDDIGDVFLYSPPQQPGGPISGPDSILRIRLVSSKIVVSVSAVNVTGDYDPIVGDFDGNGLTDVLWYGFASHQSYLWYFHDDGSHTSRRVTLPTDVIPGHLVIDANGDGIDDILWKGDVDHIWIMHADGSHSVRSGGSQPSEIGLLEDIVGRFGTDVDGGPTDRRYLQRDGRFTDELWIYDRHAGHTTHEVPDLGGATGPGRPAIVGHFHAGRADSLLFYDGARPNRHEFAWDFDDDGAVHGRSIQQVAGAYATRVGDFDGNGYDDVVWYSRAGTSYLWSSDGTSFTSTTTTGVPHDAIAVAVLTAPKG